MRSNRDEVNIIRHCIEIDFTYSNDSKSMSNIMIFNVIEKKNFPCGIENGLKKKSLEF